jgi:DNA-binding NarL/FixJ family response regulator
MIDQQFSSWQLSLSEKDVALLLIKGFSMKEIAEIRKTQEKTVRHQATTVYRKSGLSGRQQLAAFFLEDILSLPS